MYVDEKLPMMTERNFLKIFRSKWSMSGIIEMHREKRPLGAQKSASGKGNFFSWILLKTDEPCPKVQHLHRLNAKRNRKKVSHRDKEIYVET